MYIICAAAVDRVVTTGMPRAPRALQTSTLLGEDPSNGKAPVDVAHDRFSTKNHCTYSKTVVPGSPMRGRSRDCYSYSSWRCENVSFLLVHGFKNFTAPWDSILEISVAMILIRLMSHSVRKVVMVRPEGGGCKSHIKAKRTCKEEKFHRWRRQSATVDGFVDGTAGLVSLFCT